MRKSIDRLINEIDLRYWQEQLGLVNRFTRQPGFHHKWIPFDTATSQSQTPYYQCLVINKPHSGAGQVCCNILPFFLSIYHA